MVAVGMFVSMVLFVFVPAWLLGVQYNFAVGAAYCAVGLSLFSIWSTLQGIRDDLKAASIESRKGSALPCTETP